jgi:hypothetical protein
VEMINRHLFRRPKTTQERRQWHADHVDALPARVRTRCRPTSYDDVPHGRRSKNERKHRSRR